MLPAVACRLTPGSTGGTVSVQQLLAGGSLLRVLSFCRNDSTLLLMGRLVGLGPAAAEADVLVQLCCCWAHCCEAAAGQMGACTK